MANPSERHESEHEGEVETGTRNESFDLVSILYHALRGARACATYVRDAEAAGDRELADFFREIREEDMVRAERAKLMLAQRLELEEDELDDLADDEGDDSGRGAPI